MVKAQEISWTHRAQEIRQRWHDYFANLRETGQESKHLTVYLEKSCGSAIRLFTADGEQVSPQGYFDVYPAPELEPNVYIGRAAVYSHRFNTRTGEKTNFGIKTELADKVEKEKLDPSEVAQFILDRDAENLYRDSEAELFDAMRWRSVAWGLAAKAGDNLDFLRNMGRD